MFMNWLDYGTCVNVPYTVKIVLKPENYKSRVFMNTDMASFSKMSMLYTWIKSHLKTE